MRSKHSVHSSKRCTKATLSSTQTSGSERRERLNACLTRGVAIFRLGIRQQLVLSLSLLLLLGFRLVLHGLQFIDGDAGVVGMLQIGRRLAPHTMGEYALQKIQPKVSSRADKQREWQNAVAIHTPGGQRTPTCSE